MTDHDDDLRRVADRLRASRPQLTPLEFDEISQRVRARVAAQRRPRSAFMKSRLTILAMLVVGMLLSTAGAGLAVSGLSHTNQAAVGQYGDHPGTAPTPAGQVLAPAPAGKVLGEEESGGGDKAPGAVAPATAAQPARQVEASTNGTDLPFTGYAAIPILLGGVVLLGGGLVLRHRTRGEQS